MVWVWLMNLVYSYGIWDSMLMWVCMFLLCLVLWVDSVVMDCGYN